MIFILHSFEKSILNYAINLPRAKTEQIVGPFCLAIDCVRRGGERRERGEEWVEGVGIIRSVWRLLVLLFGLSAHSEKCFLIIVLAFFRTLFLSHFRNIGASTIYI